MPGGHGFINTYIPKPWGKKIIVFVGQPIFIDEIIKHHSSINSHKTTIYKVFFYFLIFIFIIILLI